MRPSADVTVIEPRRVWSGIGWRELSHYRDLFYFLVWRDVKVRYKQTVLGALWAIIQPVMYMIVFSVFFGRLAGVPSDGLPYPVFFYAGFLPWMLFSAAVSQSANSVIGSAHLITKVYFPRLIIPAASIGSAVVDFAVASSVLALLMAYYGIVPGAGLAMAPLLVAGTLLLALGIGLLTAALNVTYRDVRYIVPFALQLWLFVTPIIYPVTIVPDRWQWLLRFNPLTGLVDGFRASLLGRPIGWGDVAVSFVMAGALFIIGIVYFRFAERTFADVV